MHVNGLVLVPLTLLCGMNENAAKPEIFLKQIPKSQSHTQREREGNMERGVQCDARTRSTQKSMGSILKRSNFMIRLLAYTPIDVHATRLCLSVSSCVNVAAYTYIHAYVCT